MDLTKVSLLDLEREIDRRKSKAMFSFRSISDTEMLKRTITVDSDGDINIGDRLFMEPKYFADFVDACTFFQNEVLTK